MDIYIPKEQMPSVCKECHFEEQYITVDCSEQPPYHDTKARHCAFGCWADGDVYNGTYSVYDSRCFDYETQIHSNCPLKPIDQWRLESCESCKFDYDDCSHRAYPRDLLNQTCKDWQGKVNE